MRRVIVIVFILLSYRAEAQSPVSAPAQVITFEDALFMLNGNPQFEADYFEEEAAELQRRAAFGLRLPEIGLTGTYMHMSKDIKIDLNGAKAPITNLIGGVGELFPEIAGALGQLAGPVLGRDWAYKLQDRDVAVVGATITLPVYTGGKINAANNAARIQAEEARERGTQSKNVLISELVERYFGLSLANQVVDVRLQVLEGMEKHLYDAVQLEANGMIARGERLFAEMNVADARKEYQKSVRDAYTTNTALANTLNQDDVFLPVTTMFIVENLEDVNFFKGMALSSSSLLKQVDLKERLALEDVRLQRSEFVPQVALLGAYDIYNYQLNKAIPRWMVGAGVNFTIFNGLRREYKYKAAQSQVKQVQALGNKAENDILTAVETLYNQLQESRDEIEAVDKGIEFADEYLRIKEEAFREGMATSSDVVDARLNLAAKKTERLMAAYTYDVLLARLLELCGDSDNFVGYIAARPVTPVYFE